MNNTIITIKDLTKSYGNKTVLSNLDFSISAGQILALLGRNGEGKTTLLHIISNVIRADSGFVELTGKQRLTIVPQENNCLLSDSVLVTLLDHAGIYGIRAKIARDKAESLLRKFNLWERRHTKIHQLSTGLRKILMLLRSLIIDPSIILMDEVTAGLDYFRKKDLLRELMSLKELGLTMIISSHQLEDIYDLCDSFAILSKGKIKEHYLKQSLPPELSTKKLVLVFSDEHVHLPEDFSYRYHRSNNKYEIIVNSNIVLNDLFKELGSIHAKIRDFHYLPTTIEDFLEGHERIAEDYDR